MDRYVKSWLGDHMFDLRMPTLGSIKSRRRSLAGQKVSVVLPALNEANTVGDIVTTIRQRLVDDLAIVDEIVVMDCGSVDKTVSVSKAAGAETFQCSNVLPEVPSATGKGDALWRSLHVTSGDILVFLDSDLRNFSEQWVLGLIEPLLRNSEIGLVKAAFYRSMVGDGVDDGVGGRLTEILARPLLAMYWPELAGFVQPLSGQIAARRSVLEKVPFCQGYGVDLALLIDVWRAEGLSALAQCDIGHLVHRNRGSSALGRAAAEILNACATRVPHPRNFKSPLSDITQFSRSGEAFAPFDAVLAVAEHTPMDQKESYRRRWPTLPPLHQQHMANS